MQAVKEVAIMKYRIGSKAHGIDGVADSIGGIACSDFADSTVSPQGREDKF